MKLASCSIDKLIEFETRNIIQDKKYRGEKQEACSEQNQEEQEN